MAAGFSGDGVSVKICRKARSEWLALKPDAHEGYVSWERFEAIRTMVSGNVPTGRHHGAPKHGEALLAGLIRCRRCGRKLTLGYTGATLLLVWRLPSPRRWRRGQHGRVLDPASSSLENRRLYSGIRALQSVTIRLRVRWLFTRAIVVAGAVKSHSACVMLSALAPRKENIACFRSPTSVTPLPDGNISRRMSACIRLLS